jgi:hypothetical protein
MLEAAVVLEIVLDKYIEAGVVAVLPAFNAASRKGALRRLSPR